MSQKKAPNSTRITHRDSALEIIEKVVVELHGLTSYQHSTLMPNEIKFLKTANKNLAVIHRRLSSTSDD